MFKKILVAVDGSDCANQAVWVAAYLARALGADLCVITAFDPVPAYVGKFAYQAAIDALYADRFRRLEQCKAYPGLPTG